jgi:hypothetical protein
MRDLWSRRQRRLLRLWRASAAALIAACLLTGYLISRVATTPHPPQVSAAAAPLVGPSWRLIGYRNAQGLLAYFDAEATATARFARDGTVAGSTSCQYYEGAYAVHGRAMTIGATRLSANACALSTAGIGSEKLSSESTSSLDPPPDLDGVFLNDLPRVTTYRISGTRLSLLAATGTPLLVFTASTQVAPTTPPVAIPG